MTVFYSQHENEPRQATHARARTFPEHSFATCQDFQPAIGSGGRGTSPYAASIRAQKKKKYMTKFAAHTVNVPYE